MKRTEGSSTKGVARAQARRGWLAAAAVLLVAVLAAAVIAESNGKTGDGGDSGDTRPGTAVSGGPVEQALTIPSDVFDRVGRGQTWNPPIAVPDQPVLTDGGRPLVMYFGGEYCPHCASQRWAVAVALSRFGTFSDLQLVDGPGGQILTFHGSSYTSDYLVFQGIEIADTAGNPLDELTDQQQQVLNTLNAPPYVPAEYAGGIPFMSFANQYIILGSTYDAGSMARRTPAEIAAALAQAEDPIAQGVLGSANMITTLICRLTEGQPGDVCTGAAARAYEGEI